MDRKLNGPTVASSSSAGSATRSSYPPLQPNYSIPAVQEALEHLASIDLIDLCKEAKIECCRATRDLRSCDNLKVEEMESRLSLLLKFIVHVAGISNVLEVLESSFKGTHSAHLQDLHQLQESILKTKQHLEIMIWCIRHQFLENVRSRYKDSALWDSAVRERRSGGNQASMAGCSKSLFRKLEEEIEVASLLKNGVKEMADYYPFKSLQDAVDVLFLHGSSELVIAKQAIFLYYLFDRHWTICDEEWRGIIEDFAATFSITRHSLLESLIFNLLDDTTDDALQTFTSSAGE
ncbi:E3 ubiquitin-protein ligase HOS1-like protein [Quillaja saponaria]|uniref:E3 ubiquitin-protein ligase HOS1-like protein n=1 Tax=Quillaja saponaria TaxID=32244 RepID=A0AAD7PF46_QUISA|nr:E3 ubiquitin-protein ligase HOS1-like protein [Quillaja saponaria]